MAPFDGLPRPPADLSKTTLPTHVLAKGTTLWRVHRTMYGPLWFDPHPPEFRFDDPAGKYGVCYLGETHHAAFAETFLRSLPTHAVSTADLHARAMSACTVDKALTLVAAFGPGLVTLGTTASVSGAKGPGGSYAHSQEWSRALYDHPDGVDGIAFMSSHDNLLLCTAVFDRVRKSLSVKSTTGPLDTEKPLLADIVKRYKVAIL